MIAINLLLYAVLFICVITDLKSRKIYNKIIFPSLLFAFVFHLIFVGWNGLLFSIIGFFTGLGILLIPYLMGGIGAGDVKLLALIGALKGASFVFTTAIYMGILGGLIALSILFFRKGVIKRMTGILYSVCGIRYGFKIPLGIWKEDYKTTYPYGLAIAGGAMLSFWISKGVIL